VIAEDGEVDDLPEVDMSLFRPAQEVLTLDVQKMPGMRVRGP